MDLPVAPALPLETTPVMVLRPARQTVPVIFASPHSGRAYPSDFLAAARLDPLNLRRSEDGFVDELFSAAPDYGAPLLAATFPRAFCDANREPWELDPAMFADPLPSWVNTTSARVGAGLGTIARIVASGETIYRGKLSFAEAERRVRLFWRPFHETLEALIAGTRAMFGGCLLVDCHSMPSHGGARTAGKADFVLGDAHGTACNPLVTSFIEQKLTDAGLYRPPQRSLCRRLHHPPLRPAARACARGAARDRPGTLHGRVADRATAAFSDRPAGHNDADRGTDRRRCRAPPPLIPAPWHEMGAGKKMAALVGPPSLGRKRPRKQTARPRAALLRRTI